MVAPAPKLSTADAAEVGGWLIDAEHALAQLCSLIEDPARRALVPELALQRLTCHLARLVHAYRLAEAAAALEEAWYTGSTEWSAGLECRLMEEKLLNQVPPTKRAAASPPTPRAGQPSKRRVVHSALGQRACPTCAAAVGERCRSARGILFTWSVVHKTRGDLTER